uniref:EKA-like protein n=1 Tax=Bursaphelenchus xylophilus TaxID=6326 RepID=A0A1I7RSQ0_BURXY
MPIQSTAPGEVVISAAPQMRNFKKETTKFVPAALQVRRPATQPKSKPISRTPIGQSGGQIIAAPAVGGKSADQTCDEFLREISDLL